MLAIRVDVRCTPRRRAFRARTTRKASVRSILQLLGRAADRFSDSTNVASASAMPTLALHVAVCPSSTPWCSHCIGWTTNGESAEMEPPADNCKRHAENASGHVIKGRRKPTGTRGDQGGRQEARPCGAGSVQVERCVAQWSATIPHADARSVAWPR